MKRTLFTHTSASPRKRTGLFYHWFISYITVLLIPILICSYYYIHTYHLVKESNIKNQTLLLEKTQNSIDTSFQELIGIAAKIRLMNSAISLSYAGSESALTPIQYSYVTSLQNDFHLLQVANNMVLNISIYFPAAGRVLSADAIYTESIVQHMGNRHLSLEDMEFLKDFYKEDPGIQTFLFYGHTNGKLYLSQKLVLNNKKQPLSILIFELDASYIQDIILDNYLLQDGSAVGLMYDGACLLSTDQELTDSLVRQDISFSDTKGTIKSETQTYIVTLTDSDYPGISLFCLTPQSVYNHQSDYLIIILFLTIMACLSVGFITTYFYSRRNYRPVKNILEFIGPAPSQKQQNEYELILNHLIHSRTALTEQIEEIHNEFLRKILSGEIQYQQINNSVKDKFHFSLPQANSIVTIIHIENYESFQHTVYQKEELNKSITLLHFIIQNVLMELLCETFSNVYFCYLHSNIAVICNTDLSLEKINDTLSDALQKLLDFSQKNYHFNITAGISRTVSDPNDLSIAFTQATDALEYIHLFKITPIYSWQQEPETSISTASMLGTSDTLVNYVLSASSQNLTDYFRRLRREISSSPISLVEAKDMVYFFYRTSLQIKAKIYKQYGPDASTTIDSIDRGIFHSSLFDVIDLIESVYLDVCSQLNEIRQVQRDRFSDRICKYIDNNYNDANLNLNNIALYFTMSPAYLSKLFKAEREESVIDYLYHVRITQSIQLLKNPNLKITDIASLVGFQDSSAYIRIFKKEKGMSPGKYRETKV